MKPVSPELLALIRTKQFYVADLYTFELFGGGVLRYSAGDKDITANGILYPMTGTYGSGTIGGPYFDRKDNKAKIRQKIGIEVDQMVFDVIPGAGFVFGDPFLQACHEGQFDNATFMLDRAFMATYGDTAAGVVNVFKGVVAEVDAGRSLATFTVNSRLELLNQQWPRNLYQAGCINNLGDAACGVDLNSFMAVGSAVGGSSQSVIVTATSGADGTLFNMGKITFTSGILSGLSRTVQNCDFTVGQITLVGPFPSAPSFGDAFQLFYGCDKSLGANGCPKFSNTGRYRGFPFIPQPVTAL